MADGPPQEAFRPGQRLLTPNEVAERLSVSVAQVYTLLRASELPGLKIGKRGVWRVDPAQLEDYIDGLKEEALSRVRERQPG